MLHILFTKYQQPHGSKSQNRIVIIQNKENILTPFPFCDEKNLQ
jgi:hypothetical protein